MIDRSAAIIFQDNDILAVDKPEGVASIPERDKDKNNILESLSRSLETKLYIVHRLDKEVSGVLLFAKNETAHRSLNVQFERREVHKTYAALVQGVMGQDKGTIEKQIRQFGSGRMGVDPRGKECITRYRVIKRFKDHTLVHAEPATGRRHQLRVHFYSINHPIAGDLRYGDRTVQEKYPRLMLHAQSIEFRLPSGKDLRVESPLPESFVRTLESLREGRDSNSLV